MEMFLPVCLRLKLEGIPPITYNKTQNVSNINHHIQNYYYEL